MSTKRIICNNYKQKKDKKKTQEIQKTENNIHNQRGTLMCCVLFVLCFSVFFFF